MMQPYGTYQSQRHLFMHWRIGDKKINKALLYNDIYWSSLLFLQIMYFFYYFKWKEFQSNVLIFIIRICI